MTLEPEMDPDDGDRFQQWPHHERNAVIALAEEMDKGKQPHTCTSPSHRSPGPSHIPFGSPVPHSDAMYYKTLIYRADDLEKSGIRTNFQSCEVDITFRTSGGGDDDDDDDDDDDGDDNDKDHDDNDKNDKNDDGGDVEESESESVEFNSQALEEVVNDTVNKVKEGLDEVEALNMALSSTDLYKKKVGLVTFC